MEFRAQRSRARAAARLVAALVVLAAPPILLAGTIGDPRPSLPIDWANVVEAIQVGLMPASVWVNVLAVAAWCVWMLLVGTLIFELVAVARNRPSAAGVPRWIRNLAQALVAAVFALAGPAQHALAVSTQGATITVASAFVNSDQPETSVVVQTVAEGRLVAVTEEDSWGGFAEQVLGDASLGPMLRTANVGRDVGDGQTVSETTAFVEPGWQLIIPAHLDSAPLSTDAPTPVTVDDDAVGLQMWDVVKGDHFWGIAEATLTDTWGRQPTDAEIVPYWRQLIEENKDRLLPPEIPNFIYPGQQFALPAPPADAESPTTGTVPDEGPIDEPVENPEPAVPTPDTSSSRGGWQAALEGSGGDSSTDQSVPDDPDEGEEAATAFGAATGLTAGVAATIFLAAGVMATIRWRRRAALQQRGPRMRLPTPLPEVDEQSAKLDAAAAADQPLEDLTDLLCSIPSDVHPVLVRASDAGEVTLFFDEKQVLPEPPAPWMLAEAGTDGPVGWQASLGDVGADRSVGLPLLVTLGRSGDSTLLANVAAMGMLGIDGPPIEQRRRLRAMSLEVATSRISVPVEVAIAGDNRLASLERVRHIDDPTDEIELALDEIDQGVVVEDRTPRLLVCHHDISPPALPTNLTGMLGVIAIQQDASEQWVLFVNDEHAGRLQLPDGGTVKLALPDFSPDLIDDELTRLDQILDDPDADPGLEVVAERVDPTTNGHRDVRSAPLAEPAWCEVRILGPVEVIRNGEPITGLPPRALEMLLYLVTHPSGVPKERLDNVLWAGRRAGGATQRVTSALTKLRGTLGDGPDGTPLVPRRTGDEAVVLSSDVGCDFDRALAHLDLADDLPDEQRAEELAAALDLVRGEPFEGKAYSWATDISQRAIVRLQDAALDAARAHRQAGDYDAADNAIHQGLLLLDPVGALYLERAQIEQERGRPEHVARTWDQYRSALAEDADEIAGAVSTPPPEIELAFRELMAKI